MLKFFFNCPSSEDNLKELAQVLEFWVQFRLTIPLALYCGVNFVKKYCQGEIVGLKVIKKIILSLY